MYIADLKEPNAYGLAPGQWVMDNLNAAESLAREEARIWPSNLTLHSFSAEKDWSGKKLIVVRGGGIGDIAFTTPMVRELKKRWPSCEITFACFPRFAAALEGNPDVNHVVGYPMLVDDFVKFDAHIYLGDVLHDGNPLTRKKHAVDLVLDFCGLTTEDKELRFELGYLEREKAFMRFPKLRPRIGIQLSASAVHRSWPKKHIIDFSQKAVADGFEILWLGLPGESKLPADSCPQFLYDATQLKPELTLRESLAMISSCDAFVAPDTGPLHVAGALGVPTIALYAAFPSSLRTSYASSIKAIDAAPYGPTRGKQPCNPCFWSQRPGLTLFPPSGPCAKSGFCEPMQAITPDVVLTKLKRHLRKRGARNDAEEAEVT